MKVTIKITYFYLNDDEGVFKKVFLKKKNFKSSKNEDELNKIQTLIQDELAEEGHSVELGGGGSDEDGPHVYDFELTEHFDLRDEARELAQRVLESFCEKAE